MSEPDQRDIAARPSRRSLVEAATVCVAAVVVVTLLVRSRTGRLGYAVDDAYIHLSLARTLAEHGTWGIRAGVYASASSSPVWTAVLAAVVRSPLTSTWWPLLLATPCAVVAAMLLRSFHVPALETTTIGRFALVVLPITIGLAPLVFTGMEHCLQVALTLAILLEVSELKRPARPWLLAVLFFVATLVRFEAMFVAAGVVVLAATDRERRVFVRSILTAAVPVGLALAGFALVNTRFGEGPLPSSVLAKATVRSSPLLPDVSGAWSRLGEDRLLLVAFVIVAALALVRTNEAARRVAIVMSVTTAVHLLYADVGWFYRYQAYLLAGIALAVLLAARSINDARVGLAVATALLLAVAPRAAVLFDTATAANDIHRDQEQVGRFLVAERPGLAVALNDIGFPSWLGTTRIVDLQGLASYDLLQLRRTGELDAAHVANVFDREDVDVAVVYDKFFGGALPRDWAAVEQWCFPDAIVLSADCITFHARPSAADELRAELTTFAPQLPSDVERRVLP